MDLNILSFYKTEDFQKAQISEKIDDNLIAIALSKIKQLPKNRTLIIIEEEVISYWASNNLIDTNYLTTNLSLFIVVKNNKLITCFLDNYTYLQGRKDKVNYILITKNNYYEKNFEL